MERFFNSSLRSFDIASANDLVPTNGASILSLDDTDRAELINSIPSIISEVK